MYLEKKQRIPKWMGLMGFLGLAGPINYYLIREPFTLIWLMWFGWFGWYYDGKMAGVLMDERYRENEAKAVRHASNTAIALVAAILCISMFIYPSGGANTAFVFLIAALSFTLGLWFFLRAYLLYRYDTKE